MSNDLTRLLLDAREGGRDAREALFAAAYPELRRLARAQLRRHAADSTMNTTALVHEAYLDLLDVRQLGTGDRAHFFGIAARAMRQILVDHFRRARADKRGGGAVHFDLDDQPIAADVRGEHLLALDEALSRLEQHSPRLASVVEGRFFGGMTEIEIGAWLGVSDRTVRTDWRKARAWLLRELRDDGAPA